MFYGEILAYHVLTEIGAGMGSGDHTYNGTILSCSIWAGYGKGSGRCEENGYSYCKGEGDGGGNVNGDCICNNETDNL
jgi:hypothetical protein